MREPSPDGQGDRNQKETTMRTEKVSARIEEMQAILEEEHPMTVRQVFYQIVSKQQERYARYPSVCLCC
jgi:ribosomal protein S6